tara:strand:- start:447 stop:1001 length:555 start_codon:yes stop_codon:yes gene_type:complete
MTTSTPVFRFKFSPEFNTHLISFAKIHQYDDRSTYKENWDLWLTMNDDMIHSEILYLKSNGYDGDVVQKMYRSGRYYFRNKSSVQQEPKQRRKYLAIDKEIIDMMDRMILREEIVLKPSILYEQFCVDYPSLIQDEVQRLLELDLAKEDIHNKLKKTYKNRYFLFKNKFNNLHTTDNENSLDIM